MNATHSLEWFSASSLCSESQKLIVDAEALHHYNIFSESVGPHLRIE